MSLKTQLRLVDVVPLAELGELWGELDAVLSVLKPYLPADDADADGAGDRAGKGRLRVNSTLVAFLTRMLPAIEAFFLVFTSEILADPQATPTASSTQPAAAAPTARFLGSGGGDDPAAQVLPEGVYNVSLPAGFPPSLHLI